MINKENPENCRKVKLRVQYVPHQWEPSYRSPLSVILKAFASPFLMSLLLFLSIVPDLLKPGSVFHCNVVS